MERQLPILILAAGGVAALLISADAQSFGPLQVLILFVCILAAGVMWGSRPKGPVMGPRSAARQIAATTIALLLAALLTSCSESDENSSDAESVAREFVSAAYSEISASPEELCDLMTSRLRARLVEIERVDTEALNDGLEPITGEVEPLPESCSSAIDGWDEQYGDDRDHPDLSSLHLTGESSDKATASVVIEGGAEPYEKRLELIRTDSGRWAVDAANLNPGEPGPGQEPLLK